MNWSRIEQAIADEAARQSLDPPAIDQAEDMILTAYKKWHPESWEVKGVEWRYDQSRDRADASGQIDLWGFADDAVRIVDWKTTGSISPAWKERQARSQQGLEYALALAASGIEPPFRFEIRAVAQDMSTAVIDFPLIRQEDLDRYELETQGWAGIRNGLVQSVGWGSVWPRNESGGCLAFGPRYPCDYLGICEAREPDVVYPLESIRGLGERRISYSSRKEFQRCPERYRRLTIEKECGILRESGDAARIGLVFHAGVAAIWEESNENES